MSKRPAPDSLLEVVIEVDGAPASKKPRTSTADETSVAKILDLSQSSLKALKKDTFVSHIVALQNAWSQYQAESGAISPSARGVSSQSAGSYSQAAAGSSSQSTGTPPLDPAKIKEKANKAASMMMKGIKQQMKWQPSCKTSEKRWSYEGVVPSPAIFFQLFRVEETGKNGKEWKQKKIPKADLYRACGGVPETSIRYGNYLRIKGEEVNLKWNKEDNSFTVSGLYGI